MATKRQAEAKVDDVYFTIEKDGVVATPDQHPTATSQESKDKMKEQKEKAQNDVASSQSSSNYIVNTIPDYNSTGTLDNSENVYIKKQQNGKIQPSSFDEMLTEKETKLENIQNEQIEEEDTIVTFDSNQEFFYQDTIKQSQFGSYITVDDFENITINDYTFTLPDTDDFVDIYDGEGTKLGIRPISYNNDYNTPLVVDFYPAFSRLITAASFDGVDLVLFRGYVSYNEQLEIRRKYAPSERVGDDQWLATADPNSNFTNEYGERIAVGKPGYGYHIFGNTIDIDTVNLSAYYWMIENAHNFGFYRTIENEIWHWEYKPWIYRLGGKENPSNKINSNFIGGWDNDLWSILYNKVSDVFDPSGAKFLPNSHKSWLGKENTAKIKDIINTLPQSVDTPTGRTFVDIVRSTQRPIDEPIVTDDDTQTTQSTYPTVSKELYKTQISKNYKLKDLCLDSGFFGSQHGLSEEQIIKNLQDLATNVIEPLREKYKDLGFKLNSCFRRKKNGSQHEKGQAVDISFSKIRGRKDDRKRFHQIAQEIVNNKIVPYDQFLLEYRDNGNVWIHISYKKEKRRSEVLTFNNDKSIGSGLILKAQV